MATPSLLYNSRASRIYERLLRDDPCPEFWGLYTKAQQQAFEVYPNEPYIATWEADRIIWEEFCEYAY